MPRYWQLCSFATSRVVPEPENGSITSPPLGQPALMQGFISSGGNTAKRVSGYGFVATVQTERLLALSGIPHVRPLN